MSVREFWARLLREAHLEIRTVIPARVQSYDPATQHARVELGVQQVRVAADGTETVDAAIVLDAVPVRFPASANCALTFPVPAGTTGHVVICDRSMSAWRSDGAPHPPALPNTHNLADAIFEPGLRPDSAPHPVASMGGVALTGPTVQLGTATAAHGVVFGDEVLAMLTALKTWLSAHTHPVSGPAAGPSPLTTTTITAPTVSSTVFTA